MDIAAEATNASLLKSMDRRAQLQLRLEETVEGLSAAAISYYALGLLKLVVEGLERVWRGIDPTLTTAWPPPSWCCWSGCSCAASAITFCRTRGPR